MIKTIRSIVLSESQSPLKLWLPHDGMAQECLGSKVTSLLYHLSLRNCLPAGQVAPSSLNTTHSLRAEAWVCSLYVLVITTVPTDAQEKAGGHWEKKEHHRGLFRFAPQMWGWLFCSPLPTHSFPSSIVCLQYCAGVSWVEPWGCSFHWNLRAEKQTWTLQLKALMCSSWLLFLMEMFGCIINTVS